MYNMARLSRKSRRNQRQNKNQRRNQQNRRSRKNQRQNKRQNRRSRRNQNRRNRRSRRNIRGGCEFEQGSSEEVAAGRCEWCSLATTSESLSFEPITMNQVATSTTRNTTKYILHKSW